MADNNTVMTERDYTEAFKEEFDTEILSEAFGFNCNIYIEVSTCEYHNKYHNYVNNEGNVKMEFH